ncbi:unnamed protein product [Cyprideis torosa]|uniref:Uncharacterized protein n=1 Tax=Cyprideis torosa TaxID=163714 RepID=A0A7R8W6E2_9CRUS|nr:unnamed protein product [Cyprideis torosa]CAG0882223.1 unnamed protein product [Cyprideis torosa]
MHQRPMAWQSSCVAIFATIRTKIAALNTTERVIVDMFALPSQSLSGRVPEQPALARNETVFLFIASFLQLHCNGTVPAIIPGLKTLLRSTAPARQKEPRMRHEDAPPPCGLQPEDPHEGPMGGPQDGWRWRAEKIENQTFIQLILLRVGCVLVGRLEEESEVRSSAAPAARETTYQKDYIISCRTTRGMTFGARRLHLDKFLPVKKDVDERPREKNQWSCCPPQGSLASVVVGLTLRLPWTMVAEAGFLSSRIQFTSVLVRSRSIYNYNCVVIVFVMMDMMERWPLTRGHPQAATLWVVCFLGPLLLCTWETQGQGMLKSYAVTGDEQQASRSLCSTRNAMRYDEGRHAVICIASLPMIDAV